MNAPARRPPVLGAAGRVRPRHLALACPSLCLCLCLLAAACGEAGDEHAPRTTGADDGDPRIAAWPAPFAGGRWIDLTHAFGADTLVWPTSDRFELEVLSAQRTEAGFYYAANRFCTAEHGGTHVDAPIHFAEGQTTVDALPVGRLMGPACVVDVRAACDADRDHRVGRDELRAWESRHGRLPAGAIVLLRTGFGRHWPDAEAYLGTAARGPAALADLSFPGLHPEAARWLVDERDIAAIGLDTASIDHGPSRDFASHVILAGAGVPVFENVADLGALPATGAYVLALPMKIAGGSGGPLRIVAWVTDT